MGTQTLGSRARGRRGLTSRGVLREVGIQPREYAQFKELKTGESLRKSTCLMVLKAAEKLVMLRTRKKW